MSTLRWPMLTAVAMALLLASPGCATVTGFDPPAATSRAPVRPGLRERLDASLRRLEANGFSGAVMVARDGERVLTSGYGIADRGNGRAAGERTLFQLASVTKQFTAAAILRLEMDGKLSVSDPIGRYFDDVPADKRPITLHQLLTHTSGLPDRAGICSSDSASLGRNDYVRLVLAAKLRSKPGKAFRYSNDGYGLLGAIIERASGTGYEQYLRERLFNPSRMTRTGYTFDDDALGDAARGYGRRREIFLGNLNPSFRNATGPAWCNRASGGLLSTADDMYRWYLALRGTAILSERAKTSLLTPHEPESPEATSFYAYGWTLFTTRRRTRLAAHDGSLSGYFTADLQWYLDEDVVIFVAANSAGRPAQPVSREIARIVFAP